MVFFLEIINIWQKSRDFWLGDFFLEILKSIGWYRFSYGFSVVLNLFHQNILQKLTKKRATSKIWTEGKKVNKHPPLAPKNFIG
jgi:hypothetical protein